MSATLPRNTRHRLLAEYLHFDPMEPIDISADDDAKPYPRVTIADPEAGSVAVEDFSADPERDLTLRLTTIGVASLGDRLAAALVNGGTMAVICNTVNRAQSLFRELHMKLPDVGIEIDLFHARFPLGDRQKIEDRVLKTYGKGNTESIRPARVLVATQVVEQSLDLDFDLMVTEYSAIDLILQRAGRLHRHKRKRPLRFEGNPELWLLEPDGTTNGVPDFGPFEETVYARYILLRSYLALRDRQENTIALPGDIEELVESVYADDLPLPEDESWAKALVDSRAAFRSQQEASEANAKGVLVRKPDSSSLLRQNSRDLSEEDDPITYNSKMAKTREGDPTVDIVLAYRIGATLSLTSDGSNPINPNNEPRRERLREIGSRPFYTGV